jgi:hypothetical protein
MHLKKTMLALIALNLISCGKRDSSDPTGVGNQYISVLTQHNNNTRAGYNDKETILTTANVNAQQFGKRFSLNVDDQVYAQPLVVANVTISGDKHNTVYIATVNNQYMPTTVTTLNYTGKRALLPRE